MNFPLKSRRIRWVLLGFLVLLCAAAVSFLGRPQPAPPPPLTIFPQPYAFPHEKVALLDRLMPRSPSWTWLWRVRYAVLGRPKSLTIHSSVVEFFSSADPLEKLSLREPDYSGTDGLQVWRLGGVELTALRNHLKEIGESVFSPRVTTGDGSECAIFSGFQLPAGGAQIPVGFQCEYSPRIRKNIVDLTAAFTLSETVTNEATLRAVPERSLTQGISIRTNLAFAARVQIPKGTGVFLLNAGSAQANSKRIGVVISANQN